MRVVRPPIFNVTTCWRSGTLRCWQDLDPHMPCQASDAVSVLFLRSWSVFQKEHSSFHDKDTLTSSCVQSEGFPEKLSGVSLGVPGGAGRSERSGSTEAEAVRGAGGGVQGCLGAHAGSRPCTGPWTWACSSPARLPGAHRAARPGPPACVPPCFDSFAG